MCRASCTEVNEVSMLTCGIITEKQNGRSKVRIGTNDACGKCGKCSPAKPRVVTAEDMTDSIPGDRVEIEINDRKYAQSILLLYIAPLIAFAAGVVAGYYAFGSLFSPKTVDIVAVLCGIILMLSVYAFVRLFRKHIDKKTVARVIAITGKEYKEYNEQNN